MRDGFVWVFHAEGGAPLEAGALGHTLGGEVACIDPKLDAIETETLEAICERTAHRLRHQSLPPLARMQDVTHARGADVAEIVDETDGVTPAALHENPRAFRPRDERINHGARLGQILVRRRMPIAHGIRVGMDLMQGRCVLRCERAQNQPLRRDLTMIVHALSLRA
jgi:hypothetical protein